MNIQNNIDAIKTASIIKDIVNSSNNEQLSHFLNILHREELFEACGIIKTYLPEFYTGILKRKHLNALRHLN